MRRKRRQILKGFGVLGVGGVGGYLYSNPQFIGANEITGPPSTNNKIAEEEFDYSIINKIEFYESGAAIITPTSSHSCFEVLNFTHNQLSLGPNSDDVLATWELKSFDEPLIVDLKSVIASKENYPSEQFKIRPGTGDSSGCISPNGNSVSFGVPTNYMP